MTKVIALIVLVTNGQTMIWAMPMAAMRGCEMSRDALLQQPIVSAAKCVIADFSDLRVALEPVI